MESSLGEAARDEVGDNSAPASSGAFMNQDPKPQLQWNRLGVGLALAALSGIAFGHAITSHQGTGWWTGLVTLLCGALLILSTVYARNGRSSRSAQPLGHILITRGWITENQLSEALARHHRDGRPIGQLLVEMKVITPVQLSRALGQQTPLGPDSADTGQVQTIIASAEPEPAETAARSEG